MYDDTQLYAVIRITLTFAIRANISKYPHIRVSMRSHGRLRRSCNLNTNKHTPILCLYTNLYMIFNLPAASGASRNSYT